MPETKEASSSEKQSDISRHYWETLKNWHFMKPALALCSLYATMIAWSVVGSFLVIKNAHYDVVTFGYIQALVLSAFIAGNRLVGYLLEKYSLKAISTFSAKIAGISGCIGLLLNVYFPNQLFAIILFILSLNFSLGLGIDVFNRLFIESSKKPLDIKVSFATLFINLSAFLTSTIVRTFFSQNIFRFSLFLFILSLITFFAPTIKKQILIKGQDTLLKPYRTYPEPLR